ncbi:MAG: 2-phosphosulfolactate phosphatase [Candidatus Gastranaerophilales bacterium]|nr:2-phosphosulfolactate phosphatase [Candidatus Gastranaerophilales bacterium]
MYIDVVFNPCEFQSRDPRGKSIAVIDVLRATTSIMYAFWGYRDNFSAELLGCEKIIPVETIEEAIELSHSYANGEAVLTGERFCLKPKEFDIGNSPNTYTPELLSGKTIVYTTTNGTRALQQARQGIFVTTSAFVNATKSAEVLFEKKNDVIILCAGRSNKTTIEDSLCAGLMVSLLVGICASNNIEYKISDSADIAMSYYQNNKEDIKGLLLKSEAGQNLLEVGLEADIEDCTKVDYLPFATKFEDGVLTLIE